MFEQAFRNIDDIQEKDRFDVVLANPPFGGKECPENQQNFKTGETAFLFLQHFIKILRAGGRAGIVIKNTFLSNTDNASVSLRRLLLESCNLFAVLDCPAATSAKSTRSTTRASPSSWSCKRPSRTRPGAGAWTRRPSTRRPGTFR
jgi:type I restriction-modification system DNA methylase subunit